MSSNGGASASDADWLTLLSQEQPASAFERLRLRQMAGAGVEEAAKVDATARQALQVRAMMGDRRQRLVELAALNQLAGRLTAIGDHSLLLAEVARQARRLLSVDVTYLMLLEPDGILRIEVVDGSIGSALRGIELPIGTGIGGHILETGRPYAAADYLHDRSLAHKPDVDEAARSERLGGILGVPLRLGEQTIGALFAAERRPRPFLDGEVSLLTALASHAALAINNARMLEDARRSARELDEANSALRSLNEAASQSSELHDRLVEVVVDGGGLPDVLAGLAAAISACACFSGKSVRLGVAADGRELEGEDFGWIPQVGKALRQSRPRRGPSGQAESGSRAGRYWLSVGVPTGLGEHGQLLVWRDEPFDDVHRLLLEGAAAVVSLAGASERAVRDAERRAKGEFIAALLSGSVDHVVIRRRAQLVGVDLDAVAGVVLLDAPAEVRGAVRLAQLLAADGGWAGEYDGRQVVLSTANADQVTRICAAQARLPCTAVIAPSPGGVAGVATAHNDALETLRLLDALGRDRICVETSELGIFRKLLSSATRSDVDAFVAHRIGPLLDFDRARGRDLVVTLRTYLAEGRHHARTCERLHVHANTLYGRLARIQKILGDDWTESDRLFEIDLALRLHGLAAAVSGA